MFNIESELAALRARAEAASWCGETCDGSNLKFKPEALAKLVYFLESEAKRLINASQGVALILQSDIVTQDHVRLASRELKKSSEEWEIDRWQ